jgi:hypothetical protein
VGSESYWHLADVDFAAEHVCSWESADSSDFENTLITITPAVMRAIPISAGRSSTCLAQTQATAVISTIPNPDQTAYTIPVGIVRSGKERSQNAATKQKTDMMLGTGFEKLLDAASAVVAITSVRIAPAKHK